MLPLAALMLPLAALMLPLAPLASLAPRLLLPAKTLETRAWYLPPLVACLKALGTLPQLSHP